MINVRVVYFVLVFLALLLSTTIEPIFAGGMDATIIRTEIDNGHEYWSWYGKDEEEYFITEPDEVKVKAWGEFKGIFGWIKLVGRYLNFDVYKENSDGSRACVFHKRKLTNLFTGITTTKFSFPRGAYILVVSYDGNKKDQLAPTSTTRHLHFLQKV